MRTRAAASIYISSFLLAAIFDSTALASAASAAKLEVLHEFTGPDGSDPIGGLTVDRNTGTLYGAATYGGAGFGTVFSLKPPKPGKNKWKFQVIYTFKNELDGSQPATGLALGPDGTYLLGTTLRGSTFCGCGTIFVLNAEPRGEWKKTTVHQFQGDAYDGAVPNSTPVYDPEQNYFFGTTGSIGGDTGTIYGITLEGSTDFSIIYNPAQNIGDPVGTRPFGVFIDPVEKLIVGTAYDGASAGTLFAMDFQGHGGILHGFAGTPDGAGPAAPPLQDSDSNLYGSTIGGGNPKACPNSPGCGTIWKQTASRHEKVLHSFAFYSHPRDGQSPISPLVLDEATRTLYGATFYGGTGTTCGGFNGSCGTVFSLDTLGDNYQVLWEFPKGGVASPNGQLVLRDGALYGVSYDGGQSCADQHYLGCGTVWKLTP